MRKVLISVSLSLGLAALLFAADYVAVASNKQLMAGVQKPAMDALAEMMKAGGPKDDAEWAKAAQSAALLAETTQLLHQGGRPKDKDVWPQNADKVIAAAQALVKASEAKDTEAFKTAMGGMGAGCRGCHNVYKKKKQG